MRIHLLNSKLETVYDIFDFAEDEEITEVFYDFDREQLVVRYVNHSESPFEEYDYEPDMTDLDSPEKKALMKCFELVYKGDEVEKVKEYAKECRAEDEEVGKTIDPEDLIPTSKLMYDILDSGRFDFTDANVIAFRQVYLKR